MQIISSIKDLNNHLKSLKTQKKSIGLVPTMGALHDGHISLVRHSKEKCDVSVVSIFVNPVQFNSSKDLKKYPRDLENDLRILEKEGIDVVFTPKEDEIYPSKPTLSLSMGEVAQQLEGHFRPGHFEGVALIVAKLFNIVQPDVAFFGQKDLQQLQVIRKLVRELSFPVDIVGVPTVREKGGLAMSSRNQRLSEEGHIKASVLYESLNKASKMILEGKEVVSIVKQYTSDFDQNPDVELEYFHIVNPENMLPVETYEGLNDVAICIAAYVEGIRLIDNLYLRLKI